MRIVQQMLGADACKATRGTTGTLGKKVAMKGIAQWLRKTLVGSKVPSQSIVLAPDASLLDLDGFTPPGFECGIEILNDSETSMEFVVSTLRENAGMDEMSAVRSMLEIHKKGGAILKLKSIEESLRVAALIQNEARQQGFPLVCRAISAQHSVQPDRREDAAPG